MLGPNDTPVADYDIGATLSRTDTVSHHAPLIEKRTTLSSERDSRAIV